MRPHALHPGAIQGKEGIKFCHLATLAPIKELNAVRKRISELKGGRLAVKATRSGFRVIGLIISDVVGDPLGLIASGPTVLNDDDPALARQIIERWAKTHSLILSGK